MKVMKWSAIALAVSAGRETPNKSATGSRLATESIFSPVFGDRLHQKPGF